MRRMVALVLVVVACNEPAPAPTPVLPFDAARPTRVFDPPPGEVRPVPPFAIRSEGVGPYLLGDPVDEVLYHLPRGPRIEILQIEGVAEHNLVRVEEGKLLVGAQPRAAVQFVAVLDKAIARTAGDLGVGSSGAALRKELGEPIARASDRRLLEFSGLPGVRFLMDRGRVAGALIMAAEEDPPPAVTDDGESFACPAEVADLGEVRKAAGVGDTAPVAVACATGEVADLLVFGSDTVALVAGELGSRKRLGVARVPGLLFAAAIDADADGLNEVAVVYAKRETHELEVRLDVFRWEAGRLSSQLSRPLYKVTVIGAAWTGADVDEIDLLVELHRLSGGLEARGIYVRRAGGSVREMAPLLPQRIAVRQRRPRKGRPFPAPATPGGKDAAPARAPAPAVRKDAAPPRL